MSGKRLNFVDTICNRQQLGLLFHEVERSNIYNDVLSDEKVLEEFPLRIRFGGEIAFDTRGVCRDMFPWD